MLAAILFILGVTVGNSWVQTINPRSLNYPLTRQQATDDEDQGDFITRVFKKFMPDPAEMGMKRMTIETAPEQYYCTKDRWADPVSGDDQIAAIFRPVLAQTNFEKRKVELAFDANRDGWSADAFHQKLDAQGPAVVFCRSKNGGVFGGYNPKGWVNYGEFRGSLAAFLFVFPDGNTDVLPLKLSKAGGAGLAQVDDGGGPKFGMEDLGIPLSERSPKMVRSKLGAYYERMPGGENSLLPGYAKVDELIELKVYTGVYEKDEYRPFTDAEPFALN